MHDKVPKIRLLLLLGAVIALLAGLNAALLRLGLTAPVASMTLASLHGVLMVYGFLGTAITLERAVALQSGRGHLNWLAYLAPASSGVAVVTALVQVGVLGPQATRLVPGVAWSLSMSVLIAIYVVVWKKQPMIAVLVQLLGAVSGLAGILLWTSGLEVAQTVPFWGMFLVLTIFGERMELARLSFGSKGTEPRVLAEICVLFVALALTLISPEWGYPLLGLALGAATIDIAWHDIAKHTIRTTGITRFMAACMLAGYGWALVAAGIWIVRGPVWSGYGYDTVVHALTIGFALSMVLAHAPVIVPAIARRNVPYHPAMWAVWALIQAGLLIRVTAGARMAEGAWQFGGALDVVAVIAFVLTTLTLILTSHRRSLSTFGVEP